jgi:hypothetical protein
VESSSPGEEVGEKWVKLEGDAEALRRELGEDRWVLVFRNAGRQAQKMFESVERSVDKLQEAIDTGAQHSNPPALAKRSTIMRRRRCTTVLRFKSACYH